VLSALTGLLLLLARLLLATATLLLAGLVLAALVLLAGILLIRIAHNRSYLDLRTENEYAIGQLPSNHIVAG
jgi:hypothetical protein